MNKTKLNGNLWKILVYISGILITVGIYMTIVQNNCKRIEKVEVRSEQNERNIIGIQKDIDYIKKGVDDIKLELKTKN